MAYISILLYCACLQSVFAAIGVQQSCQNYADFSCGFESLGPCPCWRQGKNGPEDDLDWALGNEVAVLGLNSIPRGRTGTGGTFAYAVRDGEHLISVIPRGAMLVSSPLPCISKGAVLKLWFWKAAILPQLRICYMLPEANQLAQCVAEVAGIQPPDWIPWTVPLHATNKAVQIVIQAKSLIGFQTVVGIDDISIEGNAEACYSNSTIKVDKTNNFLQYAAVAVKNESSVVQRSPLLSTESKGQKNEEQCPKATDLEEGEDTEYNRGVWKKCSNSSCDIESKIWLAEGGGTFVLATQIFKSFGNNTELSFEYSFMERTFTSKVKVCIDGFEDCPFSKRGTSQKSLSSPWSEDVIHLQEDWHQIFFVVTNLRKTDKVKIRRVSIRINDKHAISGCSLKLLIVDDSHQN